MELPVSRHPTLPPILTTPEPVPVRETRRKRSTGVWAKRGTSATDDLDDLDDSALTSPRSPSSGKSTQIEAVERRVPSISGKLSDDTLKAMLQLQEASGEQSDSGATPTVES